MLKLLTRLFFLQTLFLPTASFNILPHQNFALNSKSILKQKNIKMISEPPVCPEYLEKVTDLLDTEKSEAVVKGITGFLTKVDGFGGYVLHMNDVMINCILNNDHITMETKKSLVLFFIKMSQMGDSTGSHILQFYHDLVNCLL